LNIKSHQIPCGSAARCAEGLLTFREAARFFPGLRPASWRDLIFKDHQRTVPQEKAISSRVSDD